MKTLDEFLNYFKEQIYAGGELESTAAIIHYSELCENIISLAGEKCPYLLEPLRLLIMHLEACCEYERALNALKNYKDVVQSCLYIDNISILSADLIEARLLAGLGKREVARSLAASTKDKIQNRFPHFD